MARFSRLEISSARHPDDRMLIDPVISLVLGFYTAPSTPDDIEAEYALDKKGVAELLQATKEKKPRTILDIYDDPLEVDWNEKGQLVLTTPSWGSFMIDDKSRRLGELKGALREYLR